MIDHHAIGPVTEQVVELVTGPPPHDAEVWLDLGERAFLDTVGVLMAGASQAAVKMVAALIDERDGRVISLAIGGRMSARSAALVDGTSAHVLDYDDVDDALVAHLSAVLVPALLASAQETDAKGLDILDAFRVGVQASRAVGEAIGIPDHYRVGWHSSGTIGTIGAAAAVARLLRLAEPETRCALGIAGSLAGGSRQNFGTMTKPLHVGAAASSGLSAARLAALGFTADPDMLDGPLGFVALHRGSEHAPPPVTESSLGLNVKMLPCCYATHEAAEAATSVAASRGPELEGAGVISVDVTVHPGGLAPLIHHRPLDGVQAKFSMEYVVAAALLDGGISFSSFDDRRVDRADVQDLLRRVRVDTADVPPEGAPLWDGRYAVVAVRYSDGTVRSARIDRPLGHVTRPLTEDQLRAKFKDCLRTSVPDAVDAAYTTLRRLRVASSAPQVAESLLALHPTVQEAER